MSVRSVLYLPASNPRAVEKARALTCDVAVLDLEDAVAPEAKAAARVAAVEAVRQGGFAPRLGVRINSLDTEWGRTDLEAVTAAGCGLIVLPKAVDAEALSALAHGLPEGCALWAMIETPRALLNLHLLAGVGGALQGLMLGTNDLALGLGTGPSPDREPLKPWLAQTVAAARAYGLIAIDGVFNAFRDAQGFAAEAAQARLYGFDGKSLIHPDQIAPCHAAFAPTEAEIARAGAVIAAFAAPAAEGKGAIQMDGGMVERLHLDAAHRLLAGLRGE